MFQPPGFQQHSVVTRLGRLVYYTAEGEPWTRSIDHSPDRPTLVFLHGFGGGSSSYEWSQVYPAFASDYRILAPDLIGWGQSDHPAHNYQVQDYLDNIADFLEQTCTGPVVTIASSLVAAITIRLAILQPERFSALILSTPAGLSDFGQDYSMTPLARMISLPMVDRLFYRTLLANSFGIQTFLEQRQFAQGDRLWPELVNAYQESASQPNADYAALSFVRGDLCFDLAHYIPQLTVPTAMIWGQKATYTTVDVGRRLAELNQAAVKVFQALPEVGLTPQLEQPATTIGLIRHYLTILLD